MLLSNWSARFSRVWSGVAGRAADFLSLQPRVLRRGTCRAQRENDREEIVCGQSVVQGHGRADSRRCFRKLACSRIRSRLLRDRFTGQPRGFGFAEIGNDAEAEKAIAALNGKDFLGRALVVNEARPQREGGGAWRRTWWPRRRGRRWWTRRSRRRRWWWWSWRTRRWWWLRWWRRRRPRSLVHFNQFSFCDNGRAHLARPFAFSWRTASRRLFS